MNERAKRRVTGCYTLMVYALPVLVLSYFLSAGPVNALVKADALPVAVKKHSITAYQPLGWIIDNGGPGKRIFIEYLQLWE